MDTVPTLVSVTGIIFGIAGGVGAVLAFIRTSMAKTTIELFKTENDALNRRMETLESEKNDRDTRIAKLEGTIAQLIEERNVLRDLATGHSAVEALTELTARHHKEIMMALDVLMASNGHNRPKGDV